MTIYADRLKILRVTGNLTKDDLTKILKLKNGTINAIESGKQIPTQKIAAKLSAFFETDVEYWLDLNDEIKKIKYFDVIKEISEILNEFDEEGLIENKENIFEDEQLKTSILNVVQNFYIWKKIKEHD